ncbi:MAG: Transcription termination protein NusB, partial [uncultured Solirubrobacteraceae bacterium]
VAPQRTAAGRGVRALSARRHRPPARRDLRVLGSALHPRAGPCHRRQRRGARRADRAPRPGLDARAHRAAGAGDPAHRAAGDASSRARRRSDADPARGRHRRGCGARQGVLRSRGAGLPQRGARSRAARAPGQRQRAWL